MKPTVTVIIPTRNRPERLADALTSVRLQNLPRGSVKAVVVNDAGVDVSAVVAEAVDDGLSAHLITLPARAGLPAARNAGLTQASSRYVAFLDDDDIFLPGHLTTALNALESGSTQGVYTTCVVSHQRIDPLAPQVIHDDLFDYPFDPNLLTVFNYIPVHSLVLKRPSCGFDDALPALEDWDMWLRLTRQHGYSFEHVAAPSVVYHRIPDHDGITANAATRSRSYQALSAVTRRVWDRWPPATPRAARFRAWLGVMNWHVLAVLAQERTPPLCYYEHTIRAITAAWHGQSTEDDLMERIAHAVEKEPHADTAAA